jgi:hypothetical protein
VVASIQPRHPGPQQLLVFGVLVADRRDHGQSDGLRVELATGPGPPYPAAAPLPSMPGDAFRAVGGTARELGPDGGGQLRDETLGSARMP